MRLCNYRIVLLPLSLVLGVMRNKVALSLILLFNFGVVADDNLDPKLEKLLEEVKLARLNSMKADLSNGVHSVRGYMSSGLFYLCSLKHGLHIRDSEEKEKLINSEQQSYVEFTASFSDGAISVIEVHTISEEPLSTCEFIGQGDDT